MQQQTDQQHWTSLWKRHDGFQARLARRFSLARQTINDWGKKGEIPIEYCAGVEAECAGEFRRWHFRPDDWHAIWPELRGIDGAPEAPCEAAAATESAPATSQPPSSLKGAASSPPA